MNIQLLTGNLNSRLPVMLIVAQYYVVSGTSQASKGLDYPLMIDHLMRSRPDVIISGEVSIRNAFPILRLLNTGHGGFMCTVHANSPELALEEAIPANIRLSGMEIPDPSSFLRKTIDMVIQLHKVGPGKRAVTELWRPQTGRKINVYEKRQEYENAA